MEWMIVYFIDDIVETVPSTWVYDDVCYWPPYNGSKLIQAISSCMSPIFDKWDICKIRQLANGRKFSKL